MTTDTELLAEAEGVLRAVEWSSWSSGFAVYRCCPCCGESLTNGRHAPDCELYRVLGRLAGRREGARDGA